MIYQKQPGQVVIIMLLIIIVALAIGLSVVGRSISDISSSINTENSSRAFSAAEAGIEKLFSTQIELGSASASLQFELKNQSLAKDVKVDANIPKANTALEYPPFTKSSFAQFWLASPSDPSCAPSSRCYTQDKFDIYFGTAKEYSALKGNLDDQPAIEVNVIVETSANEFISKRYFFDSYNTSGTTRDNNGFTGCSGGHGDAFSSPPFSVTTIPTNNYTENRLFYCKATVEGYKSVASDIPYMVRVRLLYTNTFHPVAIKPALSSSLPLQTNIYKSTGVSGTVQRQLNVFREKSVMPQFFDYAFFSASDFAK